MRCIKKLIYMRSLALMFFLLSSFSALADGDLYSWKTDNCPALASVPESNPYIELTFENMGEWNQQEEELMVSRGIRFNNCRHSITSGMSLGVNAFRSYQSAEERGDAGSMELLSHDATMLNVEEVNADLPEPFADVAKGVFNQAYNQEIYDMFKADPGGTEKMFYDDYFCDCLNIPLSVISSY